MLDFNAEIHKFKPALNLSNVADEVRGNEKEDIYELLRKIIEMKED